MSGNSSAENDEKSMNGTDDKKWTSVLIIDDDQTLVKTARPILISHGYAVLTADTGELGLNIAKAQQPDLILLDVILPGIKGRDVCEKLKAIPETASIPVIFLTAKNSEDDVRAEMAAGAVCHLTKPVDADVLLTTIRGVVDVPGDSPSSER